MTRSSTVLGAMLVGLAGPAALAAQTDATISMAAAPATPRIQPPFIVGATPGTPFLFTVPATGTAPLSYEATGLPAGLTLDASSGIISGTTPAAGTYPVAVTVTNGMESASATLTITAGDTLALTPPMGWNSYDSYGGNVTEAEFLANAQALKTRLAPFGWNAAVIDFHWYDPEDLTDANGRWLPSPSHFPSAKNGAGFKPIADQVHAMGLLFGIHIMRGIPQSSYKANTPIAGSTYTAQQAGNSQDTTSWDPTHNYGVKGATAAGMAWYASIFAQYASWGLDFVKVDDCVDAYHQDEVHAIRAAIDKSGRSIVFSLSPGPNPTSAVGDLNANANQWRIVNDFWDVNPLTPLYDSSQNNVFYFAGQWQAVTGLNPGHWPDPDMLPLGQLGSRQTAFSHNQQVTILTLWSVLPAPLIFGGETTALAKDAWTSALLTNEEVLAVDQDSAGIEAKRVAQQGTTEVWARDLSAGRKAVALFNHGTEDALMSVSYAQLGVTGNPSVRDLWHRADVTGMTTGISATVPHESALLYVLSPPGVGGTGGVGGDLATGGHAGTPAAGGAGGLRGTGGADFGTGGGTGGARATSTGGSAPGTGGGAGGTPVAGAGGASVTGGGGHPGGGRVSSGGAAGCSCSLEPGGSAHWTVLLLVVVARRSRRRRERRPGPAVVSALCASLIVGVSGCSSPTGSAAGAGGAGGAAGKAAGSGAAGSFGGASGSGEANGSGGRTGAAGQAGGGGSGPAGSAGANARGGSSGGGGTAGAAGWSGRDAGVDANSASLQGPCDIFATANTPCVAAHSTVRLLASAYGGPLYQVRRASDGKVSDIAFLRQSGAADSAAQDAFCRGTTCTISILYDQSGRGNHLTRSHGGAEVCRHQDREAVADALPLTVAGHMVYGIKVVSDDNGGCTPAPGGEGTGYRLDQTTGVATGDDAETEYMVTSGDAEAYGNSGCCFDYGNVETDDKDDGAATMEAIYFGGGAGWGHGGGSGPWVMADMENGIFSGSTSGYTGNSSVPYPYVTAVLIGRKGGTYALMAGNAQTATLTTMYDGARPGGYTTMKKQGAIVLGTGGDNSDHGRGYFFEGVMTAGAASAAVMTLIQANIQAAGYGR